MLVIEKIYCGIILMLNQEEFHKHMNLPHRLNYQLDSKNVILFNLCPKNSRNREEGGGTMTQSWKKMSEHGVALGLKCPQSYVDEMSHSKQLLSG
jgi:hypothetical protein